MEKRNQHQETGETPEQQKQLKQAKEKVIHLLRKNIFIVSGDLATREELKGHLKTLGFSPDCITATSSSTEIINKIKHNVGDIDLIICHFNVLDSHASSKTGFQLFNIAKDMLLKTGASETIPFIFIEKKFDKKDIISAFKNGASQLLTIPTNPIYLSSKLVEVFNKPDDSSISQKIIAILFEANKLRKQGLFENAIALYNKALGIGGENLEVIIEKADAYLEIGDFEQAIQLYKRAIEIEATFARAYQGLGNAYQQMGDITEARNNFMKVLELEPNNVQVYFNVAVLYQNEGDYTKAKRYFTKGIELNKKFIKNYLGLAKNFEQEENPEESINVYKQALRFNPGQTFLYISAGDFCLEHNLFQQAEELFTSAISINADHIHLYNRLGIALRKQKKYDQAIKNYAKAIKIKPDDATLHYNQAKAYFCDGEKLVAISILNKAFTLDSDLKTKFQKDKPFSSLFVEYPEKFQTS